MANLSAQFAQLSASRNQSPQLAPGTQLSNFPRTMDGPATARQTMLNTDAAYVRLLDAQSTWPAAYRFSTTQPVMLERPILGVNAPHVGPRQVPTESQMVRTIPAHTRVVHRASQNRLFTPLYGRAPYRILHGIAGRVDEQSKLRQSHVVPKTGSRYELAEASYDSMEFVTLPRPLIALPELRLGMLTRVGATYHQPRDHWHKGW